MTTTSRPPLPDGGPFPATRAELLRRRAAHLAKHRRKHEAWADADSRVDARSLPPGDLERLDARLLTPFDARDRPDLHQVSSRACAEAHLAINGHFPFLRVAVLTPAGLAGLVLVLVALDPDKLPDPVTGWVGLALLLGAVVGIAIPMRDTWHRQQRYNRLIVECELYRARAWLRTQASLPAEVGLSRSTLAQATVAALVTLSALVTVRSVRDLSVALQVLTCMAAAIVVSALALWRKRLLHVVPLLTGGASVLAKQVRQVDLRVDDDGLQITATRGTADPARIPLSDILGVVTVGLNYPFAPPAVGILTNDTPVVLAGYGVADLPAVQELRRLRPAPTVPTAPSIMR